MDAGEYRERLRLELADLGVATWEDDTLDQALRQALEDYNDVNPDQAIATHTFASASREAALSASTFARLIRGPRAGGLRRGRGTGTRGARGRRSFGCATMAARFGSCALRTRARSAIGISGRGWGAGGGGRRGGAFSGGGGGGGGG